MDLVNFTPIQRTTKVQGIFIPGIIRNGDSHFFTYIEVYSDGIIEAWGTFDLEFFKRKLDSNWIAVSIPDGYNLSIHHVSDFTIRNSSWIYSKNKFYNQVVSYIKEMNPDLTNLCNFHGSDTVQINGVNYSRLPMSQGRPTDAGEFHSPFRKKEGEKFTGFLRGRTGKYYLCCISVFQDASVKISACPEPLHISFDDFKKRVDDGVITTEITSGTKVIMYGLGEFEIDTVSYVIDPKLWLSEIEDAISKLNDRPTTSEECRKTYDKYLKEPTVKLRDELRKRYERVPEHLRRYILGDMDVKDIPIRIIIYGQAEIENWSHHQAAKILNHDLPSINVPRPADESDI